MESLTLVTLATPLLCTVFVGVVYAILDKCL